MVTGKPLHLFGSEGREEATGRGVMYSLEMALEDEFQIEIPDKDAEAIKTVGDAVKYIQDHQ